MTKSTITREESVQAVFDLKVGYRLGFADLEILKRVARMALAAMGSSESVELPLDYLQGHKDGLEWAAQLAESITLRPETGFTMTLSSWQSYSQRSRYAASAASAGSAA